MSLKQKLRRIRTLFLVKVKEVAVPYEIKLIGKNRFKGDVAVVTGGSGAIGRAICFRLAAEGALVYVCGTHESKVQAVVQEIQEAGLQARPLIFNILDEKSVKGAFQSLGKIDLLVCCAGGGARDDMRPFLQQSMEVIDYVLNVNLRGSMLCTREACKPMVAQKRGNVVIISSTVGVQGMSRYSEYAAAKAGLMAFVKSIAMELGKDGIRINCVTPGIILRGEIDERAMDYIKNTNWLNSYGKPEDIANMVAFLHSDEAGFITGQNFIVDGGRSLGLKNN